MKICGGDQHACFVFIIYLESVNALLMKIKTIGIKRGEWGKFSQSDYMSIIQKKLFLDV